MTTQFDLNVVFLGTPAFAAPTLDRLVSAGFRVVGVYTQPDRPGGRSKTPVALPVKRAAVEHGLPVYQPRSLRRAEVQEELRALKPDIFVLAAYGLILPQAVLDIPRFGGLNVHPSLLPKHRGPAPIVGALLAGDEETGVSIMLMDAGMDTGPVVEQQRYPIAPDDDAATLTETLAKVGADLMVATIPDWVRGRIVSWPQDDAGATYTKLLMKEDGWIDWNEPAKIIARKVRAYRPWPGIYTNWNGRRLEIVKATAVESATDQPGRVVPFERIAAIQTGDGLLVPSIVQVEGKRAMPIGDFLRGAPGFIGSTLG